MRVLAIGLGGAGGRIVDMLYRTDRRSSKVACVQALAVDVDADSLSQLTGLPDTAKIFFPLIDLSTVRDPAASAPTATIDIAEVTRRVQTAANSETDAIIFCLGLGGSLADAAPRIITALRTTVTEPIFGLVTLPCLKEGERCSAEAADDLEMIAPLLDGVIIFDNETWYKKIKAQEKTLAREDVGFAKRLGFGKKQDQNLTPAQKIYALLNQAIVRRISLILRAGEFKADGGIELAEVVLDAGEVLNTMRGMGFMTIGYAVEQLPSTPLNFLTKLRPAGFFADEHQKKASRIIDLAKQAIYHEISAPCDITSAHKALVLIAGPSHELSLKGYMTVRKWIDRSIAGLETRSGDYPVTSTKFVAIIIMLSGLENIPRIEELKEIRTQYRSHLGEIRSETAVADVEGADSAAPQPGRALPPPSVSPRPVLRDEMISVSSGEGKQIRESGVDFGRTVIPQHQQEAASYEALSQTPRLHQQRIPHAHADKGTDQSQQRPVPSGDIGGEKGRDQGLKEEKKALPPTIKKMLASHSPSSFKKGMPVSKDGKYGKASDPARQKIERELQKQRAMAIPQKKVPADRHRKKPAGEVHPHPSHTPGTAVEREHAEKLPASPDAPRVILKKHEMKKIVLHKKKNRADPGSPPISPRREEELPEEEKRTTGGESGSGRVQREESDTFDDWIGRASLRAKEKFPENEELKLKDTPKAARDAALLHTNLKRGRTSAERHEPGDGVKGSDQEREIEPASKKHDKKRSDDVTWVK